MTSATALNSVLPAEQRSASPLKRWRWWIIMFCLLFVAYPLSFGPAVVLAIHYGDLFALPVMLFYWPLGLLTELTGTNEALGAYGKWWIAITGGDPRPEWLQ